MVQRVISPTVPLLRPNDTSDKETSATTVEVAPATTLDREQTETVRTALRDGLLGDYATEVDLWRQWNDYAYSTAYDRARYAERTRTGAR